MPPQQQSNQQNQSGILQSAQNIVTAIRDLITGNSALVDATDSIATAITTAFPPISSPSSTTTPPAGGLTFSSSQPDAFGIITTSSGAAYKIALYPSS